MALSMESALINMKKSFPSWSDIRKRTDKSVGGALIKAYAREADYIQDAINDYRKMFFLMNYLGKEEDFPDYLWMAAVGTHDTVKVVDFDCEVTDNDLDFYNHLDTKVLYQAGYLMFHERILPKKDKQEFITYQVPSGNIYMAGLQLESIWNAFDEFALFSGIKRYPGETNKELAQRVLALYKEFPNPTAGGLRNAVKNALTPVEQITDEEIDVFSISDEKFDMSREDYQQIYEELVNLNRDILRAKIWNRDTWEHGFQKTDYIPHVWDAPMEVVQDGVGYNDSLRTDYIKRLGQSETTDIEVNAYKRDFEKIRQYIGRSNIQASIQLTLTKYTDKVNPKNVEFCVRAYDVQKIGDPNNIRVLGTRRQMGEWTYYVDDLVSELYGVTRIKRGQLESNASYKLKFTPKGTFSGMSINKCSVCHKSGSEDIRKEHDVYKLQRGSIVNENVKAHITSVSQVTTNSNMEDCGNGITVGRADTKGSFGVDVTGMSRELINYKASCRRVDITSSSYVEGFGGFVMGADGKSYTNNNAGYGGRIEIGGDGHEMSCNSYSFTLEKANNSAMQGAVTVTECVDGDVKQYTYLEPQTVVREFKRRSNVKVIIEKHGQYPVTIKNIAIASYDINIKLADGTALESSNKTVRLPQNVEGKILVVEIIPYTAAFPVIEYLHIGGSLKGARYELEFDTNGLTSPELDIDTDCDITLYKKVSGSSVLVGSEFKYTTKDAFKNTSGAAGQIVLDLTSFGKISGSSRQIQSQYRGTNKRYIELAPGEEIETINISGEYIRKITNKTLMWHLFGDNTQNKELYASRGTKGCVLVKDTVTGAVSKMSVYYKDLDGRADTYRLTGLPSGLTSEFATASGEVKEIADISNGNLFERLGIAYTKAKEYVAYNTVSMVSEKQGGIELVNTFTPVMSMSQMRYYVISPTKNATNNTIVFGTSEADWSLGIDPKGVNIATTLESKNKDSWIINVNNINSRYILANEVPLDERYFIESEGLYRDLREFMVEPEAGLKINYEIEPGIEETLIVQDGLVTKLKYANIESAVIYQGASVVNNGYELMKDEGLIIWSDKRYAGLTLKIVYSIRRPSAISYTREYEDKLYKMANFSAEAYKLIGTATYKNCADGSQYTLRFDEEPDKVVTSCSNATFNTSVINGVMTATRIKDEDQIAVHNGYIYDHGREYYYFSDEFNDKVDRFSNVELHDVTRLDGDLFFHMRSTNYLPYSNMKTSVMADMCSIDFRRRLPVDISMANHLTACESFNMWHTVNMKIALTATGLNGYGLALKSVDKTGGFAALNITSIYKKGNIISLQIGGDLKGYVVEETQVGGLTMTKSVFLNMDEGVSLKKESGFSYLIFEEEPKTNVRYYLVLTGKSGTIDDLVAMPYTDMNAMIAAHTKNINKLNFKIEEKMPTRYEYDLDFDINGAAYQDLNVHSQTWEIETSANVEYGLTQVASIDLTTCIISRMQEKKGRLETTLDGGIAKTPIFFVHSKSSVYSLHIKVNDFVSSQYKGFTIKLYGSNTRNGDYQLLKTEEKTNVLSIPHKLVRNYYYVEVIANKNKVIHSIEAYARYAETEEESSLVPLRMSKGTFISKIYDMGESANYILKDIDYETNNQDENVEFYIRGVREGKNNMVFTPWRKFAADANKLKEIRYDDYELFQFKVNIKSPVVTLKVDKFRMVVAS